MCWEVTAGNFDRLTSFKYANQSLQLSQTDPHDMLHHARGVVNRGGR